MIYTRSKDPKYLALEQEYRRLAELEKTTEKRLRDAASEYANAKAAVAHAVTVIALYRPTVEVES